MIVTAAVITIGLACLVACALPSWCGRIAGKAYDRIKPPP